MANNNYYYPKEAYFDNQNMQNTNTNKCQNSFENENQNSCQAQSDNFNQSNLLNNLGSNGGMNIQSLLSMLGNKNPVSALGSNPQMSMLMGLLNNNKKKSEVVDTTSENGKPKYTKVNDYHLSKPKDY